MILSPYAVLSCTPLVVCVDNIVGVAVLWRRCVVLVASVLLMMEFIVCGFFLSCFVLLWFDCVGVWFCFLRPDQNVWENSARTESSKQARFIRAILFFLRSKRESNVGQRFFFSLVSCHHFNNSLIRAERILMYVLLRSLSVASELGSLSLAARVSWMNFSTMMWVS